MKQFTILLCLMILGSCTSQQEKLIKTEVNTIDDTILDRKVNIDDLAVTDTIYYKDSIEVLAPKLLEYKNYYKLDHIDSNMVTTVLDSIHTETLSCAVHLKKCRKYGLYNLAAKWSKWKIRYRKDSLIIEDEWIKLKPILMKKDSISGYIYKCDVTAFNPLFQCGQTAKRKFYIDVHNSFAKAL